jgi:hypothetical protein
MGRMPGYLGLKKLSAVMNMARYESISAGSPIVPLTAAVERLAVIQRALVASSGGRKCS